MASSSRRFVDAYQDPFWQEVLRWEALYLRRELAGCEKVLDVGCGAGAFERRLPELNIIGLDKDSALLAEAKKSGSSDFVQGDAMSLCFRGGMFDGIFFVTSLEFMEDYRVAVAEAARVLGGGGKFVAMMLNPRSWHFRSRYQVQGSYFRSVKVLRPELVRDYASLFFPTEVEYFMGIKEGRVFDSSDKILASLYVVKGRKR